MILYVLLSLCASVVHVALLWPEGHAIALLNAPLSGIIGIALCDTWVCFRQARLSEVTGARDTLLSTLS